MFINLDSAIEIPKGTEEYIAAYSGYLSNLLPSINKYLVSSETMDTLYPSHKKYSLDEQCLKSVLNSDFCFKKPEIFWKKCISDCIKETKEIIALGLYLSKISTDFSQKFNIPNQPSIFLCPERIQYWAEKTSVSIKIQKTFTTKILTTAVTFHELAHAHMDGGKYKGHLYEKVIEESLANAVAYELLSFSARNKAILRYAFSLQPFEYKSYVFWHHRNSPKVSVFYIIKYWRDRINSEKLINKLYRKVMVDWFFLILSENTPNHLLEDSIYYIDRLLSRLNNLLYEFREESDILWQILAVNILQDIL